VYDLGLQAQAANPGNPDLIKAIGILAYLKGDLPKAVSILKESSKARTEDAEVWYYLGIAQLQVKDVKGGRISLDQALRIGLNPKFSAAAQKALSEMK
jgi:Flp pilus assembly protein TadD